MWPKSIAALLWGLLLSISLTLNFYHFAPLAVDVLLLIDVTIGFVIWVSVMVFCFSRNTVWQASKPCLVASIISVLANLAVAFLK
jgi:uncharacterized protein with PQ loop repeat